MVFSQLNYNSLFITSPAKLFFSALYLYDNTRQETKKPSVASPLPYLELLSSLTFP